MISVIVPVYNKAKYLNDTLKSLDKQTTDDFEIVFVDDDSKDDSLEMLRSFKASSNKIVKIVKKKTNTGVCDTRNIGVREADGEYIMFLDADDYLDKNYIKIANAKLKKYPGIDIIRPQMIIDKAGKKSKSDPVKLGNNRIIVPRNNRDYFVNEISSCNGKIYHSSIVNSVDFVNSGFEDYEFSIETMIHCNDLLNVTNLKYYYKIIPDGRYKMEKNDINKNCLSYLDIHDRIDENYNLNQFTKESLRLKKIRTCFVYLREIKDSNMSPEDKLAFIYQYLIYLKSHDGLDKYMIGDGRDIIDPSIFEQLKENKNFDGIKEKIQRIASKY